MLHLKRFFILLLIFGFQALGVEQTDIIDGLGASHYKVRKLAFKQALELSFEDLDRLIKVLKKVKDPELLDTAERLQVKYDEFKKTGIFPLPDDISFTFQAPLVQYEKVSFKLSMPTNKYKGFYKEIKLAKILINGVNVKSENFPIINDSHSIDSRTNSVLKHWSISRGKDNIFPQKPGTYSIEFIFKTAETNWQVKTNFKRASPRNKQAFSDLKENGLQVLFDRDFYKSSHPQQLYQKCIAFIKKYPNDRYSTRILDNLNSSLRSWYGGRFSDKATLENIVNVVNETSNTAILRSLLGYRQTATNQDRLARANELLDLIKPKIEDAPASLRLKLPKIVMPYKRRQLRLQCSGKDYEFHSIFLYKVKINAEDLKSKNLCRWRLTPINNQTFYTKPFDNYLPTSEGKYKISLMVFTSKRILKFKDVEFTVVIPEDEKKAIAEFTQLGLAEFYDQRKKKYNIENLKAFSTRFPQSYLTADLKRALGDIVVQHLGNEISLSEKEQHVIANLLKGYNHSVIFKKLAALKNYSSTDKKRMALIKFWQNKLEDDIPLAPESIKLVAEKEKYLPFSQVSLKLSWKKSQFLSIEKKLMSLTIDGKEIKKLPRRKGCSGNTNYSILKYSDLPFDKLGKYEVEAIFLVGDKLYKFPKFMIKVETSQSDQQALEELPVQQYKDFLNKSIYSKESLISEDIFKFVGKFPQSAYAQEINQHLLYVPYHDASGSIKYLSDKDRDLICQILNLTNPNRQINFINKYHNTNYIKKRKEYWLKNLKVKVQTAPKGIVCGFPKEITLFKPFDFYIIKPEKMKHNVKLVKVVIGDCEILLSSPSAKAVFRWERTKNMPFKEGIYPVKLYTSGPKGYWLVKETTTEIKSLSGNKSAHREMVESGIASAFCEQSSYDMLFSLDKKGLAKKIIAFVKKYPNDPYRLIIANRISNSVASYSITRLSKDQIKDVGTISNLCAKRLTRKRINNVYKKSSHERKAILDQIKEQLTKPQVYDLKKLTSTYKNEVLPYEQLDFSYSSQQPLLDSVFVSYISVDNKRMYGPLTEDKTWQSTTGNKRIWYFRSSFYKTFPFRAGEYDLKICLSDRMDEYICKGRIKIYLPESEKEAYKKFKEINAFKYFNILNPIVSTKSATTPKKLKAFIAEFPKSKYITILKEKLLRSWYKTHTLYRHLNSEKLLSVMEMIDKPLSQKMRAANKKTPFIYFNRSVRTYKD